MLFLSTFAPGRAPETSKSIASARSFETFCRKWLKDVSRAWPRIFRITWSVLDQPKACFKVEDSSTGQCGIFSYWEASAKLVISGKSIEAHSLPHQKPTAFPSPLCWCCEKIFVKRNHQTSNCFSFSPLNIRPHPHINTLFIASSCGPLTFSDPICCLNSDQLPACFAGTPLEASFACHE